MEMMLKHITIIKALILEYRTFRNSIAQTSKLSVNVYKGKTTIIMTGYSHKRLRTVEFNYVGREMGNTCVSK